MRSALFGTHAEAVASRPGMALQNSKMLKATLDGELIARQGTMVAYQGDVDFRALGAGGIARYVQQRLTGEGVPLMSVTGRGEVFLADLASEVFLVDLEGPGDALTINGRNVLAFEPSLRWDIQLVHGAGVLSAGLFNCVFTGRGRVAVTCSGTPLVLAVDQVTYADPQAAVCWSAGLRTGFHRADQLGLGTLLGRTTGEAYTMSFAGQGFVVVQAAEDIAVDLLGGAGIGEPAGGGIDEVLGGLLRG